VGKKPESGNLSEKQIKEILEYESRILIGNLKWILADKVEFLARHGIPRGEARSHLARAIARAAVDFESENTSPAESSAENPPARENF